MRTELLRHDWSTWVEMEFHHAALSGLALGTPLTPAFEVLELQA